MLEELVQKSSVESLFCAVAFAALRGVGISATAASELVERDRPQVITIVEMMERDGFFAPNAPLFRPRGEGGPK